jgi:hypothetical protein
MCSVINKMFLFDRCSESPPFGSELSCNTCAWHLFPSPSLLRVHTVMIPNENVGSRGSFVARNLQCLVPPPFFVF